MLSKYPSQYDPFADGDRAEFLATSGIRVEVLADGCCVESYGCSVAVPDAVWVKCWFGVERVSEFERGCLNG